MKLIVPFFLIIFLSFGCKLNNANDAFQLVHNEYVEKRIKMLPELKFEQQPINIQNPSKERFEKATQYFKQVSADLNKINTDNLSDVNKNLLTNLRNDNQVCTNYLKDAAYGWDPSFYNVGGILKQKLSNPAIPNLCDRLELILTNFSTIPAYYETAKSNLKSPSIKKTMLAIEKNSLGFHFLKHELMDSLNSTKCMQFDKTEFVKEMDNTLIAIKDYVAFCNSLKFEYREENSDVVFRDSL